MRSTLARISRARFAMCAAACLVAMLAPARSFATHWTVDQSGAGDFTTIQAALDAWGAGDWRDSILVMPGEYDEALSVPDVGHEGHVVGLGGAPVTSARSVSASFANSRRTRLEGLTFTRAVRLSYGSRLAFFARCAFLDSVYFSPQGSASPNLEDCDFYGRTELGTYSKGYMFPFEKLRFHAAPLVVWTNANDGPILFRQCSFEGPADTLVHAMVAYDEISFENCRFANAHTGIVFDSLSYGASAVSRCTFVDLSETGLKLDGTVDWSGAQPGITVADSRFERCGTAVWWIARGHMGSSGTSLVRDTILASTSDGIFLGRNSGGGILSTIVDGSGGKGVRYLLDTVNADVPSVAAISGCTISNNVGDGVCVGNTDNAAPYVWWKPCKATVEDCLLLGNGGAGLRVEGVQWGVSGCVSFSNEGDGFSFLAAAGQDRQAILNTSALNGGDGFVLNGAALPGDSLQSVQRNLSVLNSGAGFRVAAFPTGSFAFNDAWNNALGQYDGVASPSDSNLTLDPLFCDMVASFTGFGLQQGSPCGAFGAYGHIGARTGTCGSVTTVPAPMQRPSFAVHPTVARGSVEFVPPSTGPDGRVEIFDVTGRRHWGAAFGPTTGSLRWQGQSENGHAQPGLYWVRFTRVGDTQSQRLVWLR